GEATAASAVRSMYPQSSQRTIAKAAEELPSRGRLSFQSRINSGIRANLVVRTLSPLLQRKAGRINLRDAASAHHNFAEDIVPDRYGTQEQTEFFAAS